MFELAQVSKRFGPLTALDGCDLSLAPGRTTVLIGPSGCGKSTLLRILIGLEVPDDGEVRFDGERVDPEQLPALRQRMGYVIQDGGLFPHLSARDNIALMARYLGWGAERVEAKLGELADLTHFPESALDRFPVQLSGGQQQRVSLMRALMLDPEALLLDEPLGALDPMIRYDLQQELKQVFQTLGKSVVLVTHDLAEAAFFAHEIVLMREGRIVQRGTLAEMLDAPADAFVEGFVRAQRSHLDGVPSP
ncbi:MAG: ATP-binding cassette domain-containing protein [Myxococcota bacterium]|nr:ATP-binding cassette domain-containing protein [Myxococcota bacterium]